MLPLPAIRTVLVKLTLVYADPKKPPTRYGATVSKTGTVQDVRRWMSKSVFWCMLVYFGSGGRLQWWLY